MIANTEDTGNKIDKYRIDNFLSKFATPCYTVLLAVTPSYVLCYGCKILHELGGLPCREAVIILGRRFSALRFSFTQGLALGQSVRQRTTAGEN